MCSNKMEKFLAKKKKKKKKTVVDSDIDGRSFLPPPPPTQAARSRAQAGVWTVLRNKINDKMGNRNRGRYKRRGEGGGEKIQRKSTEDKGIKGKK